MVSTHNLGPSGCNSSTRFVALFGRHLQHRRGLNATTAKPLWSHMLNGHQAQRDFVCGTIATLSRSEQADSSPDAVINGLLKITDHEPMGAKPPAPKVSFEFARALSHAWALTEPWKSLGFAGLRRVFRCTRSSTHIEALARLMAGAQPPVPPESKIRCAAYKRRRCPPSGRRGSHTSS